MKPPFHLFIFVMLVTGCVDGTRVASTDRAMEGATMYAQRQITVGRVMPPPRFEKLPGSTPNPNYVWIKGHWAWRNSDWVWVSGRWAERPRPGAVWVEGRFLRQGNRMIWTAGHWSNRWDRVRI